MSERMSLIAAVLLMSCLLACGATAEQVNNSGHEPYIDGDYETALDAYREAQVASPESGEPYFNAGNVLYRMEEYEESVQEYDEALVPAEKELRTHGFFNRGNASFQQEKYAQAVEAYKEVLRMNPDDGDAKHNLELALLRSPPEQGRDEQEEKQDDQQQEDDEQDEEEQEDEEEDEQDEPVTTAQARQLLESVGQAAQTLQERRGQVLDSPKPPSEFDW